MESDSYVQRNRLYRLWIIQWRSRRHLENVNTQPTSSNVWPQTTLI